MKMLSNYKQYKCICPDCHTNHTMLLEKQHGDNPDTWRINGKVAILCNNCQNKYRFGERNDSRKDTIRG